ncbi:MAG: hypothetical protein ACPG21_08365 [Crocinitomicaceae bacterium]
MSQVQFYIDGNFEAFTSPKDDEKYHSSAHSNTAVFSEPIVLSGALQKEIIDSSFEKVIEFYNKHEDIFKEFEYAFGINPWFLEHFRITFRFRKFELKLAAMRAFIEEHPQGVIVTADSQLLNYFSDSQVRIEKETISSDKITSVVKELRYILSQSRPLPKRRNEDLILSVWHDNESGRDKRFGRLEEGMDKILNRESFNPKQALPAKDSGYKQEKNVDQLIANYLLTLKAPFELSKFRKGLKQLYQNLRRACTNAPLEDRIIFNYFESAYFSQQIYYLRYLAFKRFFKKRNYRSVLFINENSAQQKVVQYAASVYGVKSIGIQHGAIYPTHPAYMYGKYNRVPLLPDFTFVWGEHYRKMLIEFGGYPSGQVITSGRIPPANPFRIVNPDIPTANNKICIVYATQPQPDMNLRQRELKAVLKAVNLNADKAHLILRPHPAEVKDDLFQEMANEVGFNDFIIDRTTDLISQFEMADIFITSYSTVGAEFVPFRKPMLILDFLKADKVDYISQGVGIPIYVEDDLNRILSNELPAIKEDAYDRFIENYFYKNGNKALSIIRSIIDAI